MLSYGALHELILEVLFVDFFINHLESSIDKFISLEDSEPIVVEEEGFEVMVQERLVLGGVECRAVAIERK